jgi:hypothetical protein
MLEKMGHEGELWVEKAQTIEHHGFDRMPSGHNPHFRVLLGGSLNDFRDAEFCKHPRDQAQVISDLGTVRLWLWRDVRAVRVSHSLLLCRGMVSAPKNYSMTREWCGIADKSLKNFATPPPFREHARAPKGVADAPPPCPASSARLKRCAGARATSGAALLMLGARVSDRVCEGYLSPPWLSGHGPAGPNPPGWPRGTNALRQWRLGCFEHFFGANDGAPGRTAEPW